MRLSNKVSLVTGASRGIGRATAIALAQEGATVVAVARTQKDLDDLARTIETRSGQAKSIVCDVTSSSDVSLCETTLDAFGRITSS
jgi:3-oxoacyl-[acyl-carrier protein] reductase